MTTLDNSRPRLTSRFNDAFVFAASLHQNQTRKGSTIPYVSHLMSVAALVVEDGGTEDEAIAALLHDAVEDQGGAATRDVIARVFGTSVAAIVDGCSDADVVPNRPGESEKKTTSPIYPGRRGRFCGYPWRTRSITRGRYSTIIVVTEKSSGRALRVEKRGRCGIIAPWPMLSPPRLRAPSPTS